MFSCPVIADDAKPDPSDAVTSAPPHTPTGRDDQLLRAARVVGVGHMTHAVQDRASMDKGIELGRVAV